jgi:hypothetical protein
VDIADNGAADPTTVTRVVTWGDGSSGTITKGQRPTKYYSRAGRFTITLTLTDAAGNKRAVSWPVTITNPVRAKINKAAVWHGEQFKVAFSAVPAGTTRIDLHYGDGTRAVLKGKNQTVAGLYNARARGVRTVAAVYYNRLGATTQIPFGKVSIRVDNWDPRVTITTPKNANRIASWKTLKGTAPDKGSSTRLVFIAPFRATGTKVYCYTAGKKWIRVHNPDAPPAQCGVYVRAVAGKWSLKLNGLQKGSLSIGAIAIDWSDRISEVALKVQQITRN